MSVLARVEVQAVSKTFGSARVLTDVDLTILPGEVHGLAGQNGSGKSTLIKVLTGLYPPDPGARYRVDGREMRVPVRWPEIHTAGVAVVHQDLGLLDQLTIAENVCVGGFPTSRTHRIDRRRRDELTARTLARLGVDLEPTALVETLNAAERAEVAIARAMRDLRPGTGLVILDEATRALNGEDLVRIHALLRRIASEGSAALMITHSLPEMLAVTDRLTILRDGRVAGAGLQTKELSEQEIARFMLGSAVAELEARTTKPALDRPAAVTVTGLVGRRATGVSFAVGAGEIVGITGLPGSGYEEIPYLLAGASPAVEGDVKTSLGVLEMRRAGVARCLRAGIVLVPERRERDGLAFELSAQDNISLPALRSRGRPWFVSRRWQEQAAEEAVERMDIRPRTPSILVKEMSGGNQQKVLLAKWLGLGPQLMVLHEPTQAVDVGARRDILRALHDAAATGVSIVLVSSEAEDLAAVCDRVLVYAQGGLREAPSVTPALLIEEVYGVAAVATGSPS